MPKIFVKAMLRSGQDRSPRHMLKLHTNIENAGRTRCPLSHMTGLSQYFTPGIMQKPNHKKAVLSFAWQHCLIYYLLSPRKLLHNIRKIR